jgi:hypothetical protein
LSLSRRLPHAFVCLCLSLAPAGATIRSAPQASSLLDTILFPFVSLFLPPVSPITPDLSAFRAPSPPPPGPCSVPPIPPLDDDEARSFEAAAGTSDVVDLQGLTPATAMALERFERSVASLGGTVALTSAYRPPAYQSHLQVVWDRWKAIRNNPSEGCAVRKAQVMDEFQRHRLLESQRPVNFSDHTRGIGFDAAVSIPGRNPRLSIDRLATVSGVRRPDVAHDPVHFRLVGPLARRSAAR